MLRLVPECNTAPGLKVTAQTWLVSAASDDQRGRISIRSSLGDFFGRTINRQLEPYAISDARISGNGALWEKGHMFSVLLQTNRWRT